MRFTERHCGKAVIKNKELLSEAIEKLAKYEDTEDSKESNDDIQDIWHPRSSEKYWTINDTGGLERQQCYQQGSPYDLEYVNVGNCCTDRAVMKRRALQETLSRLLWRFSLQNGTKYGSIREKYYIYYNLKIKAFMIGSAYSSLSFTPWFISREIAKEALNEIVIPFMNEHPELSEVLHEN